MSNATRTLPEQRTQPLATARHRTQLLLACGVVAPVFYVALDVAASRRYPGYSYRDQTISELSAIGAPTRPFWVPLGFVYSALTIAFSIGVWSGAASSRALRVVAVLFGGVGLSGIVGWPFAPMHWREVLAAGGGTRSDTMHLVLAGVNSTVFLSSIGAGASAAGRAFRRFSIGTGIAVLVSGAVTGAKARDVGMNRPTPLIGVFERISVYGPMFWGAALAIMLLRRKRAG